jgi:hypothetical protein
VCSCFDTWKCIFLSCEPGYAILNALNQQSELFAAERVDFSVVRLARTSSLAKKDISLFLFPFSSFFSFLLACEVLEDAVGGWDIVFCSSPYI